MSHFRIDFRRIIFPCLLALSGCLVGGLGIADDALEQESGWQHLDDAGATDAFRDALEEYGLAPNLLRQATEQFRQRLGQPGEDRLNALVETLAEYSEAIEKLSTLAAQDAVKAANSIDPDASGYGDIEVLPKTMRMSVRTWLARSLIRDRLYDEAMPVIAEVDPEFSIDPASSLFHRGVCYHALLMKKEALADLRTLLKNEDECPVRFSRTAKLMVADIKPLKEDSLDEISRLMTDVTRRLDLGRSGEKVEDQEQKIIDKLTKLIEKLEQQQQQQQQQQQSSGEGGGSNGGQSSPMDDSRIAGASGKGDVGRKDHDMEDRWGNLPAAERKEALQKISRDLPTHYRDAIEAYFRKRATER
ncbi:MAG: hypothetical protein AAFX06_26060 [Planctomycetota bacterium]